MNMQLSMRDGIIQAAEALGISPGDLATIISYETGGTFNPTQAGPTTKWGQHRGLIQFGETQAQALGINWNDPIGSQLGPNGAIVRYLKQAGVQPGMGLLDVYSAVNAGHVGRYNASDAAAGGAPGTVYDKVTEQMHGHKANAMALLGGGDTGGGGYRAAGFKQMPASYSGGTVVPKQRYVNYVPTGQGSGSAMGGYVGGPSQVAARSAEGVSVQPAGGLPGAEAAGSAGGKGGPGNSPYERQMRQSMEREGRPEREIAQTMSNAGQGGGIQLPSFGGGKGGSGKGDLQGTLGPAPTVQPQADTGPGYELPPVIAAPEAPKPAPVPTKPFAGGPTDYFAGVNPLEANSWNSGMEQSARSPGGVPYDASKAPIYDYNTKRFLPPTRPR